MSRSIRPSRRVDSARSAPGCVDGDGVVGVVGRSSGVRTAPPLAWGLALMRRSPFGASAASSGDGGDRPRRTAPRDGRSASTPRACARCSGSLPGVAERHLVGAERPLDGLAVHLLGPVQPFGVRRTIAGQRGRAKAAARGCRSGSRGWRPRCRRAPRRSPGGRGRGSSPSTKRTS